MEGRDFTGGYIEECLELAEEIARRRHSINVEI
jgi:hypothetical protein